jgi:phospholipase/lecithinase/hemolysin
VLAIRNVLAAVVFLLTCAASVLAGPYSQLIVFGDSLSDVGNLKQSTVLFPVSPYYQGRFLLRNWD